MKKQNIFEKIFLVFSAAALLASCTEIASPESQASLTFDKTSITMTEALANVTSAVVSVSVTGNSSEIHFKSYDTDVVTVEKLTSTSASVIAAGDGTAKVSAYTEDNKLVAYCSVKVTLGNIACGVLTDFAVEETSVDTASFTWKAPSGAGCVQVTATSTSDGETVSQYFIAADGAGVMEELSPSTEYSFAARAVNNPGSTKEYASDYTDSVTASTKNDITAPGSVTVTSTVTDHTIKLSWTEPSDSDYAGVNISPADGSQTYDGSVLESVEYVKGQKTITYSKVKASTEYVFTFATKDKYGNIQGDSNNADSAQTVTVTTAADVSAPDNISDVYIDVSADSVNVAWKCSDTEDARYINIVEGENLLAQVAASSVSADIMLADGEHSLSLYVSDYDSNKSEVLSANIAVGDSMVAPSDVSVEAHYSNAILVSWTDISDSETTWTYSVKIVNANDSSEVYNVNADSTKLVQQGLTEGQTYTASVYCSSEQTGYTIRYIADVSGNTESASVIKILRDIRFNWGSRVLVPFISKDGSAEYQNVVTC